MPDLDVYLNGQMLPSEQARIAIDDAGFQHAVGLFETFGIYNGRPFRLEAHLNRLRQSAQELGLARDLNLGSLRHAVQQTIEHNELVSARVRLTLTPGSISLLRGADPASPPLTVLVVPNPPTQYDPEYFRSGVTVLIAPAIANPLDPLAGHKTLAYWSRLRTLRQAATVKAGEAIWLSITNHLASGAVSNLFLVKGGELLTPYARGEEVAGALPAPVLPGITRAAIAELAAADRIPLHRRMLSVDDLLSAEEVFLTNSSWLVLPVTRVEKKAIGDGRVGPVTQRLRQDLVSLIERETAA